MMRKNGKSRHIFFDKIIKPAFMKRDGKNISLWQKTVEDYFPPITAKGNEVYDVVIVGGGVTGVTTALELQKKGKSCILVEAHTLCFGTSGGTTAHLNTFFDTSYDIIQKNFGESDAQSIARASKKALELYKTNCREYEIDCGHEEKDGYLFSQDQKQTKELSSIYIASVTAGVDVEYTDKIPVPIEFEKAIVYHGQAQIH